MSAARSSFGDGVVHSFDGSVEELEGLLDLGLFVGLNGCSLRTEENLEAVRDYDGPEESLSQAEKFMRAVGKEPRCKLPAECRGRRLLTPLRV